MSRSALAALAIASIALYGCGVAPERTADASPAQDDASTPAMQDPTPAPPPATPAPVTQTPARPATQTATRPVTQAPARPVTTTVPAGTAINVALSEDLSSATSHQGDTFTAEVLEPVMVNGTRVIPAGSTVHGVVTEAKKAKRGAGKASLGLEFTAIDLPGGFSTDMTATLTEQSDSMKKRNAAVIGGSAAGGALLGRILGKDTKGAVIGGLVGGAIATGVIMSKEGEQVELPSGTGLTVELENSIEVPRS